MSPTLQFFNGVQGLGVQVLLRAGSSGLVFDLGTPFEPTEGPFNAHLQPRPGREIQDLLRVGWAPPIDGLFAGNPDLVAGGAGGDVSELAVFTSHHDLDHSALLPYLHPHVPVYALPETVRSYLAGGWRHLTYRPVPSGESFTVGAMEVRVLETDHGPQGAAGFLATVGGVKIAYSGDWRWHGHRPDLIEAFIETCRAARVDALLVEANRAGGFYGGDPDTELTAATLKARVHEVLAHHGGLALFGFDPRDHRSLRKKQEAFLEHGRTLIVQPDTAELLRAYEVTTVPGAHHFEDRPLPVLDLGDSAVVDALLAAPEAYVLEAGLPSMPVIAELLEQLEQRHGAQEGAIPHLHAGGAPLGPFEASWSTFEAWMQRLGITPVVLGINGHAPERDLHRFIEAIDPGVAIPIHTRAPERAVPPGVRAHLPNRGEVLEVHAGGEVRILAHGSG